MAAKFDLIVAGGGPAGLEAAKTAAENGLQVALLERKTHPAKYPALLRADVSTEHGLVL